MVTPRATRVPACRRLLGTRAALVALVAFATAACTDPGGSGGGDDDGGAVTVVAGFFPLAEAARQVGGRDVRVVDLVPAGGEPHDVELGPDAIEAVEAADLVLTAKGVQPALDDAAERARAARLDITSTEPGGNDAATSDPHVWLDPVRFRQFVLDLGAELARVDADSDRAIGYRSRAAHYGAEIAALHDRFVAGLARCDRTVLVVTHAAFAHLARRYDLVQVAVLGVGGESEPTPRRLEDVARTIDREGVTTVFDQPGSGGRVAAALARETGADVATLFPLESLTPRQAERGATYLSVMSRNLDALRAALRCTADG